MKSSTDKGWRVDLQVHPYSKKLTLSGILETMCKKDLGGIGIEDYSFGPQFVDEILIRQINSEEIRQRYDVYEGRRVIKFIDEERGKELYLIRGVEIGVNQEKVPGGEWHLLSVGAPDAKSGKTLEAAIEAVLANGGFPICAHPFSSSNMYIEGTRISEEKEDELRKIARMYEENIGFDWNGYLSPTMGSLMIFALNLLSRLPGTKELFPGPYADVNKELEGFASELKKKGYQIRIVPTSDIHITDELYLGGIGTACIEIPTEAMDFGNVIGSIIRNIKQGNYEEHRGHSSLFLIFPKIVYAFRRMGYMKEAK